MLAQSPLLRRVRRYRTMPVLFRAARPLPRPADPPVAARLLPSLSPDLPLGRVGDAAPPGPEAAVPPPGPTAVPAATDPDLETAVAAAERARPAAPVAAPGPAAVEEETLPDPAWQRLEAISRRHREKESGSSQEIPATDAAETRPETEPMAISSGPAAEAPARPPAATASPASEVQRVTARPPDAESDLPEPPEGTEAPAAGVARRPPSTPEPAATAAEPPAKETAQPAQDLAEPSTPGAETGAAPEVPDEAPAVPAGEEVAELAEEAAAIEPPAGKAPPAAVEPVSPSAAEKPLPAPEEGVEAVSEEATTPSPAGAQRAPSPVEGPGARPEPADVARPPKKVVERPAESDGRMVPAVPPRPAEGAGTGPQQETAEVAPRPPLEAVWEVERRSPQPEMPAAVQRQPVQSEPSEETEAVRALLSGVRSGRPSDSGIELVLPRRPRPAVRREPAPAPAAARRKPAKRREEKELAGEGEGEAVTRPPGPADTPEGTDAIRQEMVSSEPADVSPAQAPAPGPPLVETEIGPLPGDLWELIGKEPPAPEQVAPAPVAAVQRRPAEAGAAAPVEDVVDDAAPEEAPPAAVAAGESEIDVDELARQVYAQLKRRLVVEWERLRGRF